MKFDFSQYRFVESDVTPDKFAVMSSSDNLSWRNLQLESESLKEILSKLEIAPSHPVFIYGNETALQVAAITACLTAGFVFVPLTADTPLDRLKLMREDLNSSVIITIGLAAPSDFAVHISREGAEWHLNKSDTISLKSAYPGGCYVMFTSGSTGKPKPVLITRANLLCFLHWFEGKDMRVTSTDVGLNFFSMGFDGVFIILANTLASGATFAHVKSGEYPDSLSENEFTVCASTPSGISRALLSPHFNGSALRKLRRFIFCGEALSSNLVQRVLAGFPDCEIWNTYGPTETTVCVTSVKVTPKMTADYAFLPIAKVDDDTAILLQKRRSDEGLYDIEITGNFVSPGYISDGVKSAGKFYRDDGNKPVYRTGDIGEIKDGHVFFYGREDAQIKLRGYRIELGEIEMQVLATQLFRDVVCIPIPDRTAAKKIVCFVTVKTTSDGEVLKHFKMGEFLNRVLPPYMIPAEFILLNDLPLNKNSKIDRSKLTNDYLAGLFKPSELF